jgi:hypothetical protein
MNRMQYIEYNAWKTMRRIRFIRQTTRGDWASACKDDLKQLEISETFEDIKLMKINKLRQIVKQKIEKTALKYLTKK